MLGEKIIFHELQIFDLTKKAILHSNILLFFIIIIFNLGLCIISDL